MSMTIVQKKIVIDNELRKDSDCDTGYALLEYMLFVVEISWTYNIRATNFWEPFFFFVFFQMWQNVGISRESTKVLSGAISGSLPRVPRDL